MEITKRQQIILDLLRVQGSLSTSQLLRSLAESSHTVSEDSVGRDLGNLKELGFQQSSRQGPARRHSLTDRGLLLSPMDMTMFDMYLANPRAPIHYERGVLTRVFPEALFTVSETAQLDDMQNIFTKFLEEIDDNTRDRWYQKWLIEFAWKSSAIEGSTYSVLETETLLIDHIQAVGKTPAEAQMIVNHQTAIRFVEDNASELLTPNLRVVEQIHRLLIENLNVASGLRKHAVGISGSAYVPIGNQYQVKEELSWLLEQVSAIQNPWSKALGLLVALSYLQPFADGNKRTARVVVNGVLSAYGLPPLIFSTTDPTAYRRACLAFYELGSLEPLKQITLASWQYTVEQLKS